MCIRTRVLLCLLLACTHFIGAHAASCSSTCETEFVSGCLTYQMTNKQLSRADGWEACKSEVQAGTDPIASKCTDATCTFTEAMNAAKEGGSLPSPGPAPAPGGGGGAPAPAPPVSEMPTVPTLCSSANQGRCDCSTNDAHVSVYTFWLRDQQRCFSVYNPSGVSSPKPVVLHSNCYAKDKLMGLEMSSDSDVGKAATQYGFAFIGLSTPEGNWEFGNKNVVNDAKPMPCSAEDTKEIEYVQAIISFVKSQSATMGFDATRIYSEGFSQNSMFSAYIAFCFSSDVVGVWQGGSGLSLTGQQPFLPRMEGQCTADSFAQYQNGCATSQPCTDCQYFPVYPCYTESRPQVDCIAMYDNDFLAGTDTFMYDAMAAEGHDARLLRFAVDSANGIEGGHKNPASWTTWMVSCFGMTEQCSSTCASSFASCVAASELEKPSEKFEGCVSSSSMSTLNGCTATCSPTLEMMKLSESPTVTLSKDKWGAGSSTADAKPSTSKCTSGASPSPTPTTPASTTQAPTTTTAAPISSPTTTTAATSAAPVSGTACSSTCETEFVSGCLTYQMTNKQLSRADGWEACKSEMQAGRDPIASKCTDATCTFTEAMNAAKEGGSLPSPGPAPAPGGGGGAPAPAPPVSEMPTVPTLCSSANQGRCDCSTNDAHVSVYTFWLRDQQRCFSVYNPSGVSSPKPVVLHSNCYATDKLNGLYMDSDSDLAKAATQYGFAFIGLSTPEGNWEFGNKNVVNDAKPMPCSAEDTKEIEYVQAIISFVKSQSATMGFDATRIYSEGFSQNSMFSAYIAFCFSSDVVGVWQGGSGLSLTGQQPFLPRMEGQCTADSFAQYQNGCATSQPCTDCQYFPVYPCYTESRPQVDCIAMYDNDFLAGTDTFMYDAMAAEGHDARLLRFAVDSANGIEGGHKNPASWTTWMVSCFGMTEQCSSTCASSFASCVAASELEKPSEKFEGCVSSSSMSTLNGCTATCSPTLEMMKLSESPTVTLSKDEWGAGSSTADAKPSTSKCTSGASPSPTPTTPASTTQAPTTTNPSTDDDEVTPIDASVVLAGMTKDEFDATKFAIATARTMEVNTEDITDVKAEEVAASSKRRSLTATNLKVTFKVAVKDTMEAKEVSDKLTEAAKDGSFKANLEATGITGFTDVQAPMVATDQAPPEEGATPTPTTTKAPTTTTDTPAKTSSTTSTTKTSVVTTKTTSAKTSGVRCASAKWLVVVVAASLGFFATA
ncbi:ShKT domain-containing protein [Pycnococcus provasolii]